MFIILMIWNGWFMSSEKQLILIILVGVVMLIYQYIKDEKKKHDEKLQRHLSKYFDSKW